VLLVYVSPLIDNMMYVVGSQTGVSNQTCVFNPSKSVTNVVSWRNVLSGSENALQQAVALTGPVSAAIDASLPSFQVIF
jgi:Papain family cysteine protease